MQVHFSIPQHGHKDPVHIAVPSGRGPGISPPAPLPTDLPSEDSHSGAGSPQLGQPRPVPNRHHQVSGRLRPGHTAPPQNRGPPALAICLRSRRTQEFRVSCNSQYISGKLQGWKFRNYFKCIKGSDDLTKISGEFFRGGKSPYHINPFSSL